MHSESVGAQCYSRRSWRLSTACFGGHPACLPPLLAAGAAVHQADVDGWTPLYFAVRQGHAAVVGALLAAASDWREGCSSRRR